MPPSHVGDELFNGLGLINRIRVDGVSVENGLADVAELSVDRVDKGMSLRSLMVARNHHAGARVRFQVASEMCKELLNLWRRAPLASSMPRAAARVWANGSTSRARVGHR